MPKEIQVLGVPMDLGQSRRGVDMGPSALRYAGLQTQLTQLGYIVTDQGNLTVPGPEQSVAALGASRLDAVAQVCQSIFNWGSAADKIDANTLYLGGDHSISVGSVKAAATRFPDLGVIWVDAHADFNTPDSSPSGNIHGMPVAALVGDGPNSLRDIGEGIRIPPKNIVQIGIRDVDADERIRLRHSNIHVHTMRNIDEYGIANIARKALTQLDHCPHLHISLDLDSLDPVEAPGVGTPVQGGLTYREAHLLMEILAESKRVRSLDVVEVNPILDTHNRTAELAVELVASLFGKQIL
ncbi:MAG: arginase [Chloroflexota bacterium]